MKKTNQNGIAVLEVLLVLILLAIVGFTGYYVWHARQTTNDALNAANSTSTAPITSKKSQAAPTSTDETANWLLYSTPSKEYSLRLADGWKLNHCNGSSFLYTYKHGDITPQAGQRAVVTNMDCGSDGGGDGFGIGLYTKESDVTPASTLTSTFKTAAGDSIKVYIRTETSTEGGLGALDKGGTYYSYVLVKSPTKVIGVSYGVNFGQADDHATIEKSLKTITVN